MSNSGEPSQRKAALCRSEADPASPPRSFAAILVTRSEPRLASRVGARAEVPRENPPGEKLG